MWFKETTRRSLWNIGLALQSRPGNPGVAISQLQHLMQIIYVELNLASDFDTSGGCHFFFNYYQQWGNLLYIRISLTTRENTLVARDGEARAAKASWGSPIWLVGARVDVCIHWYPFSSLGVASVLLAQRFAGCRFPLPASMWVQSTTCTASGPLGLASGKLPSAHAHRDAGEHNAVLLHIPWLDESVFSSNRTM